jgi:hypothetical protein
MSCPPHRPKAGRIVGTQVCADCGQPVQALHLTAGEAAAVEHVRAGGSFTASPGPRVAPGTANREDRYDGGRAPPLPSSDDE